MSPQAQDIDFSLVFLSLLLVYLFGCIKKVDWIELHFRKLKSASSNLSRLKQRSVPYFTRIYFKKFIYILPIFYIICENLRTSAFFKKQWFLCFTSNL